MVTVFVWWPAGLICCHRRLEGLRSGFSHAPNTNTLTHTHTQTQPCVVNSASMCLFLPFFVCLALGIRPRTHSAPPSPGAPLSLFPQSLFPHQFSTSSLSSLTSSCVIQRRNISSSRPAINIACPPKTVRIIIFLIITAVFL